MLISRAEALRHEGIMRPRIDGLDNGIPVGWIEGAGAKDDAPDVSLPVPPLGNEGLGPRPTGLLQE